MKAAPLATGVRGEGMLHHRPEEELQHRTWAEGEGAAPRGKDRQYHGVGGGRLPHGAGGG